MMKSVDKSKWSNIVLWMAYGLALAASLSHVAWAFGTLEFPGQEWNGWLAAVAVDAGLAALAYGIQQRKRGRRPTWTLWLGVGVFASISAFANLLHALAVEASGTVNLSTFGNLDGLALLKAVVLSATLPLLVVYLGEIVSSDDVESSRIADRQKRRSAQSSGETVQNPSRTDVLDAVNQARRTDKASALDALLDYLAENPDASLSDAGRAIGRSKSTVGNYISELERAGRLTKNGRGWVVRLT